MAEILIELGAKVVECLAGPIIDRARYLFCLKIFTRELKEAEDVLKKRLEEVKERMEEADRNSKEIMLPVKNWLNEVEKILEDVHELQRKVEEEGQSCFNVSLRYSLAKQMDNKAKRMAKLKEESQFDKDSFSRLAPHSGITYSPSRDFEDFKSRESTHKHLLEVIKNGKNKMVGLYGMGGSGKTTLAKEVGEKVYKAKRFENIIMVVVSKTPIVLKIQQEIAEQIDLKFQEETQLARARRLSTSLKNKKVLIILDDVWEPLKLEDIGIEGCHILLTTRLRNVCGSMGCETIELPLITREEAWELFKKHANLCNDSSNMFDDVGRKIVDECKGLPIAIVAVGRSLKGKYIRAWRSALWRLKRFQPLNVGQGFPSAYACLELSYGNLPSSTVKSLFLLCSMFPEDHEIHKEDLIRFGMRTLELEESIVTIEDARTVILDALETLLDSCLLTSIDKAACVKMHDLVRDVALWIARKQLQAILVDSSEVSNMLLSNCQNLKDTKALSLWNLDDNFNLSNQLPCSTLGILLLQPHGFIEDLEEIEALKVLALITYGFGWGFRQRSFVCSIPQSIASLKYLHTLCLRWKKLGDISLLGELKGLEILDLRGSQFDELPAGIVHMKMLKLLDIFHCLLEKSPLEVIGRCEQLEELYFWDYKSIIPENFSRSRLKRYVLYDSRCSVISKYRGGPFQEYFDSCDEALSALCIQGFRVSTLNSSMKDLIRRANHLWLDNCRWDHKDVNFYIKHLGVYCCQEKRFIIENPYRNIPQAQVFSHLITLTLCKMNSLEQVFQDSSMSYSLPMLQEVRIQSCPELRTYIFSHATITSLPNLRKLDIYGCSKVKWLLSYPLACRCPSLEEIIIMSCSEVGRLIDEEDTHGNPLIHDMQHYPHGNEIDRAYVGVAANISNGCFPKIRKIKISDCNKVRWLLSHSPASHCPSLETISITNCAEFERLIDEKATDRDSLLHDMQDYLHRNETDSAYVGIIAKSFNQLQNQQSLLVFLRLKRLHIERSGRKKGIFEIQVRGKIKDDEDSIKAQEHLKLDSELSELRLRDLLDLEYIWKAPTQIVSLYRLENVSLGGCPKLKSIFTLAIVAILPELRKLEVFYCEEWEGIFCEESLKGLSSSNVCFPKLREIEISSCNKVRWLLSYSLASHCPSLEKIWIRSCSEFERLINEEVTHGDSLLRDMQDYSYGNETDRAYVGVTANISNVCFPKLREIVISDCNKMRWLLPYSLASHCPSLETIRIFNCSEFERLIDEEATDGDSLLHDMQDYSYQPLVLFPNLKEIRIDQFFGINDKVRWLLSYSLASLHCPSLETIYIQNCFELERLVEGASCGDRLPLLTLKSLDLYKLPRLREIFRGEFEYKLESLPDKQINSQHKHENDTVRVVNSDLCYIRLQDLPKLEYIWTGPTQILSLHRLEEITLRQCPKLRNMFTLPIVTSLPELSFLEVIGCEEWEGICCEESLRNLSTSSIVCFPKLESIYIEDCHKVRRVFSYSLASHCPSLEQIAIRNCCQLEGVVEAYDGEVAAHHQSLFPKLNDLNLWRLPKLKEIYPGYESNHLSYSMLIEDCPNICHIPSEGKASSSALEIKLES